MGSKRTCVPVPLEVPPPPPQPVPPPPQPIPPLSHFVLPAAFASTHGSGAWFSSRPPQSLQQSMAASTCWPGHVQQPSVTGSSAQHPWCVPPAGGSVSPWPMPGNSENSNQQARGVDSYPPGGFLSLLKSTPSPAQAVSNGCSSQPINIGDDTNGGDYTKTVKRLPWTKEEDLRLVSAWLNNSNDPIQSNYKKNDQYWKDVADVYNSTTPQNRARLVKQVKDRFGRIKKRVAWFCASWKEANALYASGESDIDLMDRAMKTYEVEHKEDGPFIFKHCRDVLRTEPKWDAYLERLEEPEPDKRKFSVDGDVGQPFSLDDVGTKRPIGGKQAKEQHKRKRKDQACVIELEDELNKFVDAQNIAKEGRKEMLETQRRVSSENLEARKLSYLAAKDHKESVLLETYRSLIMQDTTEMSEDVRSEHVLALRSFRKKLFAKTD